MPYAFIAPFFLIFGAFGLYPLIYTFWISLHRVELSTMDMMEWRGLANFTELIDDERFWNALTNTFTIGVISTVPQLLMALVLAHLLNYRLRGSTFFRVAVLTPYATSIAAAALVFTMLFERDFGMINWGLSFFGVENIDWENQKWPAQFAISAIVIWRWTGYNALLYLAAMQAIPRICTRPPPSTGRHAGSSSARSPSPASAPRSSSPSCSPRSARPSSSASR